jgi:hypothetical protein
MNDTIESNAASGTTNATAAKPGAPVAPPKAKATKKATPQPKADSAAKRAKKGATTKKLEAAVPKAFSKKAVVLDLLNRKGGATMAEIMKATDWHPHSMRGFISGAIGKRMGLAVESTKTSAGERCYKITGK